MRNVFYSTHLFICTGFLKNQVWKLSWTDLILCLFRTWNFQATQLWQNKKSQNLFEIPARKKHHFLVGISNKFWPFLFCQSCLACKIKLEIDKNQVRPTWFFKLDFSKIKCRSIGLDIIQFTAFKCDFSKNFAQNIMHRTRYLKT